MVRPAELKRSVLTLTVLSLAATASASEDVHAASLRGSRRLLTATVKKNTPDDWVIDDGDLTSRGSWTIEEFLSLGLDNVFNHGDDPATPNVPPRSPGWPRNPRQPSAPRFPSSPPGNPPNVPHAPPEAPEAPPKVVRPKHPPPPPPRRVDRGSAGEAPPPRQKPYNALVDPDVMLDSHNWMRMATGAVNLTWSDDLARSAQKWADECIFQHSTGRTVGENLSLASERTLTEDLTRGVEMWTGEVCFYNFAKPGFDSLTGHFTQVVWKGTRKMGCGYKVCKDGVDGWTKMSAGILVCHYDPPGNWNAPEYFRANVFPPDPMPPCDFSWPFGRRRMALASEASFARGSIAVLGVAVLWPTTAWGAESPQRTAHGSAWHQGMG
ncbi:hypothetical protein HYH03_017167 [Edaphochlamys debaryana]|uniref:SCP domain-containing protein n=1 Tax=Edaphochlamys debaryana TaxID=47281 RepID=A0A836BPE4_9CHLO|nr:hypothetical protein HYH03_017167 [Edaphochlamys debaryana]|eukprot:KAG2484000.1 hypothetical protein HYH03_017167 [Edaphochlamys debaryana]